MMKKINVNNKLITDLSHLAKLKFDEKSTTKMKEDLKKILGFIDTLSSVNTHNVKPLIFMSEEIPQSREDIIKNEVTQNNALKNAPQKDSDYFKVPTVISK